MDAELERYLREVLIHAEKALDDLHAYGYNLEKFVVGGDDGICMSVLSHVREARAVLDERRRQRRRQRRRERIEREFVES